MCGKAYELLTNMGLAATDETGESAEGERTSSEDETVEARKPTLFTEPHIKPTPKKIAEAERMLMRPQRACGEHRSTSAVNAASARLVR